MVNYGGIGAEYDNESTAQIVVLPVPYDGTSTWIKGADNGPKAILDASANMELYDIETNTEVYKCGIYTASPVLDGNSPDEMVESVYKSSKKYLDEDKFIVTLGGEHSVSVGVIKAHAEKYPELTVLQLDAHSDMRQEYEGSIYNHACAMARASEYCDVVQVGIRSMAVEEKPYIKSENIFHADYIYREPYWMDDVLDRVSENVYITIDLDVFDPSIMSSTGTPEPGGLYWNETLELMRRLAARRNIVGFDVVELCPSEYNKAPDFLAAKLIYKILSFKFKELEITHCNQ